MVVVVANPEIHDILTELEHILERLTANMRETGVDDIPCAYQRHVVGVPGPLRCLLCRVARTIMCYHEHCQAWLI